MTKKSLLAAFAACAITVTTLSAPAGAATNDSGDVGSNGVSVYDPSTKRTFVTTNVAEADRIIAAYWTPERRAAAKNFDRLPAKHGKVRQPESKKAPEIGANPIGPSILPEGGDVGTNANFTFAVGKVFLRDSVDGDGECSAATLNTGKARLVMTAGHCVHHGPGGTWASNWSFYPGYQFGAGWPGQFTAWQLWTKTGWINDGASHWDYGIAITNNNAAGQKVVNTVGGNGIIYNPGRPFVTSFGYPLNVSNAQQQVNCQGGLSRRSIINSDQKLGCAWDIGSSGGPMLKDYDTSFPGLGWIVSVIAYRLEFGGPTFGPYFDGDTQNLVSSAENASPA